MSIQRRNFTAEQKADVVLRHLKDTRVQRTECHLVCYRLEYC